MTVVKTSSLRLLSVFGDTGQAYPVDGLVRERLGIINTEVIIEITRVN